MEDADGEKSGMRAILFIHGIAGTPRHFDPFLPLVPADYTVRNLLLAGHGGTVRDFSRASMAAWRAQAAEALDELQKEHREIYIVAHSMGTLFALSEALSRPAVVSLFLLAVPLKLRLRPAMVGNALKVYFDRISPTDLPALAARRCYGIAPDKNPFHYLGWLPRYLELFREIRRCRPLIRELKTPCFAWQSAKDEMVSPGAAVLLRQNSAISVTELPDSGHYYYAPGDEERLLGGFREFVM